MSIIAWVLALLITAAAASLQGTVGLGFAMISVPLLALIHPSLAPVPQLLVALPLTLAVLWRERRAVDLHGFWWLIGGRIPGAFIGIGLLAVASQRVLDVFISLVVLGAIGVIAMGVHVKRTPASKFAAGVASGTTGVVASIGGPPVALVYSREDSDTIRSTIAAVFTFGISMSIMFRYFSGNISWEDVHVAIVLLPAVAVGYAASNLVTDRVSQEHVRVTILVVSGLAAGALLVRAIAF